MKTRKSVVLLSMLLALALLLSACDSIPGRNGSSDDRSDSSSSRDDSRRDDDDDDKDDSSGDLFIGLGIDKSSPKDDDDSQGGGSDASGGSNSPDSSSSSNSSDNSDSYDGEIYDGYIGDTMSTVFFDFVVNDAKCYSSLNDTNASPGYKFLVLNVTIKNTETYSMPMLDEDFWLIWGPGDGEDTFPVKDMLSDDQLPETYSIPISGTRTGNLVYEVPEDIQDYAVVFVEIWDNDDVGDSFYVHFTAEDVDVNTGGADANANPDSSNSSDSSGSDSPDFHQGSIGDTMSTYWFDFVVNSAQSVQELNGNTPAQGNKYLVLNVSIVNTSPDEISMFDSDFDVEWGEDLYAYPLETGLHPDQLPLTYSLAADEARQGLMVFEVPSDQDDFYMLFLEQFSSGEYGELYAVFFSV